jgi:hypothetical protein
MKPTRAQLEDVLASLDGSGLRYADVRWTATHEQHVRVRNGEVEIQEDANSNREFEPRWIEGLSPDLGVSCSLIVVELNQGNP